MTFEGGGAGLPTSVVLQQDAQAARHLVDAWLEVHPGRPANLTDAAVLELRGMVTQLAADSREAGYLEGIQVGRRQAGQLLLELLRTEGLAL